MNEGAAPLLRVTARSKNFRRAGIAFGHQPSLIALAALTASAALALVTEAELICEVGDGETFMRVDPAAGRLVATLEKLHEADPEGRLGTIVPDVFMAGFLGFQTDDEFMTGRAESDDTNSLIAQSNLSVPPGAAAATGNDFARADALEHAAEANDPQPDAASLSNSVNPTEATGDDAKGAAAASIGDDRNADVEKPGADAATAPVASNTTAKPSGRAPKAAKPKVPEATAAS